MSGKTPRYLLLVLVLAVLTCLAALLALDLSEPDTAEGPNGTLASQDETTAGQGAAQKAASDSVNDMLASRIEAIAREDTTHYALFVAYPLENRPRYIYQSSQMRSASMIKVFILAAAMERVKAGSLSLDQTFTLHASDKVGGSGVLTGYANGTQLTLNKILRLMITESDNTATNMMIDLLGMDAINGYIAQNGYHDTIVRRKMMDRAAIAVGQENVTSVTDLGNFFAKLYNHALVSPELDDVMLGYLTAQTDTECFPAELPGFRIAHKTGELDGLYDDGGIIYHGDRPLIVVGMTESYSSRGRAIRSLRRMLRAAVDCY